MNASMLTAAPSVDALRSLISGDVVTPADESYDEARLAWNLAADQQPYAVAYAESAQDIVAIVNWARRNGLRVAPQGTGHGATAMEALYETVLLKTERMRGVEIDPEARIARAEAGAIWTDVTEPAAEHGLVALHGSSPNVGVVGYTLGGGIGWLARSHGLAANSVTAVEIVTADGRHVRADRETNADLFWAVRGGGGSFGVVTAIEFALYPLTEVYAGWLIFPIERSAEVLHAYNEWSKTAPDEVSGSASILRLPPLPDIPEPLRGRALVRVEAVYQGDEASGAELMRPLRELGPEMDTFGVIPASALTHFHQDPEEPVPGIGDGILVGELSSEAIDAVVEAAGPDSGSPLLLVELRQLGGAVGRPSSDHGVTDALRGAHAMYAVGLPMTPELAAAIPPSIERVKQALEPWKAEHTYFNFSEAETDADEMFDDSTYALLQQVKARHDADELFVSNHPVRPAR
jgi:UDP-N-acetylenolpyruvoylglucosamine reductase